MMPSPILNATLQSCVLTATSNIIAQLLTAYRHGSPYTINWIPVSQFVLFMALNCPPNFVWQSYLESSFPSHSTNSADFDGVGHPQSKRLNLPNTIIKFLIDQSIGSAVNTVFFCLTMATLRGATTKEAIMIAKRDLWPIMSAGWTLWPLVSFLNYAFLTTVEMRTLVGSLAGMCWGIYLSLVAEGR